jgi:hypothetical protein
MKAKYKKRDVAVKVLPLHLPTSDLNSLCSELFFLLKAKHKNLSSAEGAYHLLPGDKYHKIQKAQCWIVMDFYKGFF